MTSHTIMMIGYILLHNMLMNIYNKTKTSILLEL